MIDTHKVQLHIGCGDKFIPGFIHIDVRPLFPHVDYVVSADKLEMFAGESVDLVYASHILEHFRRPDVGSVLREWYRVLKVGGVIRLAVPDFETWTRIYLRTRDLQLVIGSLMGRQDYAENTHYVLFDYTSLSRVLVQTGFKNVHRYD